MEIWDPPDCQGTLMCVTIFHPHFWCVASIWPTIKFSTKESMLEFILCSQVRSRILRVPHSNLQPLKLNHCLLRGWDECIEVACTEWWCPWQSWLWEGKNHISLKGCFHRPRSLYFWIEASKGVNQSGWREPFSSLEIFPKKPYTRHIFCYYNWVPQTG